jgi:hypothetical protein
MVGEPSCQLSKASRYGSSMFDWICICLFYFYLTGGVFFLVVIESTFNGGFYFSMRMLWLPVAILVFGFSWLNRRSFSDQMGSSWKMWATVVALYGLILLMSWPYVMAINAATSSGEKIIYSGPIQQKWIAHDSRGKSYQIDLFDLSTSSAITLTISPREYALLSKGDIFKTEFIRGGFGVPYRWRFSSGFRTSSVVPQNSNDYARSRLRNRL